MKGDKIKYKKGYKYQLVEEYIVKIDILGFDIETDYIKLTPEGLLTIKKGYAWDGASGPTIDTKSSIRGSLVHDVLYQLIRLKLINKNFKNKSDKILRNICTEDKMFKFRSKLWYYMLTYFGKIGIRSKSEPKIIIAP